MDITVLANNQRKRKIMNKEHLVSNYKAVCEQIKKACTDRPLPRLVAVSKYKPQEDIQTLYDAGQRHFGENYVQELVEKAQALPKDICWHFIGSLQSNKCKVLAPIPNLYAIETLDSESKANKLNNARAGTNALLNIFIQVNSSKEEQKSGIIDLKDVIALAKHIEANCPNLRLMGLMTIGSIESSKSEGTENEDFKVLVDFRDQLSKEIGRDLELSMGMSSDYMEAINQGSTNVRVGSSIFGARKLKNEM